MKEHMSYQLPKYILKASINTPKIHYEWDDTHPRSAYGTGSEGLITELSTVTPRAKIAMGIGVYEWIVGRFASLSSDLTPFYFAEATWCANVSIHYLDYLELDREYWRGPVRGPLWSAICILNDMIFLYNEDAEPALRVAWLANLALHVLPTGSLFREWLDYCVAQVRCFYTEPPDKDPFENLFQEDFGGPFVPREVLDPLFDFSIDMTDRLIDQFLNHVDYKNNNFLQAPDVMIEDGFEGIPYRLPHVL